MVHFFECSSSLGCLLLFLIANASKDRLLDVLFPASFCIITFNNFVLSSALSINVVNYFTSYDFFI